VGTSGTKQIRGLSSLRMYLFFVYGALAVLSAYLPVYLSEAGLSKVQISALLACGPFVSLLANPFWGYWSDRMQNVRRILYILLVGNFLFIMMAFQMSSVVFLYAALICFYFFQSPIFTQSTSLILTAIDGTDYKFGSFRMWGSLGWAIIAFISGPIMTWIGVEHLEWVYAALMLCCFVNAIRLPDFSPPMGMSVQRVKKRQTAEMQEAAGKSVYRNKYFMMFIALGVLISVPNMINSTFMSLFIQDLGGSLTYVGLAIFMSSIFEAPIFMLLDRYLSKHKSHMLFCIMIVSILFTLRWFFMSMVVSPTMVLFIQLMHCITFGCYMYIGTQFTEQIIPREQRSSGQAAYSLAWNGISGVIAGALGGFLYQNYGPRVMYTITGFISIIGVIGFIMMWVQETRHNYEQLPTSSGTPMD
jgi:PPP family 3-phenylpropionic acid transporter